MRDSHCTMGFTSKSWSNLDDLGVPHGTTRISKLHQMIERGGENTSITCNLKHKDCRF